MHHAESVWEKPKGYVPTWERAVKEHQQSDDDIELEPITSCTDDTEKVKEEVRSDSADEEPAEEKTESEVTAPIPVQDIPLPNSEELPVSISLIDFLCFCYYMPLPICIINLYLSRSEVFLESKYENNFLITLEKCLFYLV